MVLTGDPNLSAHPNWRTSILTSHTQPLPLRMPIHFPFITTEGERARSSESNTEPIPAASRASLFVYRQ